MAIGRTTRTAATRCRRGGEAVRGALVATAKLKAVTGPDDPLVDKWGDGSAVALIFEDVRTLPKPIPMSGKLGFFHVRLPAKAGGSAAPKRSPRPSGKVASAASRSDAARKANATRKARKLAQKKSGTDWVEAGRKAYKTRLENAAARGDREAAKKLAKLPY